MFDIFLKFWTSKNIFFVGHFCPSVPISICFWKIIGTKKMWDVRTINLTAVWGRELCYVSENEGFRFLKNVIFTCFVQAPQFQFSLKFDYNTKDAGRPCDQLGGSMSPWTLLCVRKRRIPFCFETWVYFGPDDDGATLRQTWDYLAPPPSQPGMEYLVRNPLT